MYNLVLSIHSYKDFIERGIPPFFGNCDETEEYWSWRIVVLRSLDIGGDVFERLYLDKSWNSEHNFPLTETIHKKEYFTCTCEREGREMRATYVAVTGPGTVWTGLRNGTIKYNYEIGNMILVIETSEPKNHWAEPGDDVSPEEVIRLFEADPGLVKNSSKKSLSPYSHWPKHFVRLNGTVGRFDAFPDVDSLRKALIVVPPSSENSQTENETQ